MLFGKKIKREGMYFPFERFEKTGGPTTFMRNLINFLDARSFIYKDSIESAAAIFFPVLYPVKKLKSFKKSGGKAVQRLDGVHYPSKHGADYKKLNREMEEIYCNYSDFIIFQSEYSRKQCFEMFGTKNEKEYCIIHNGANDKIFYPSTIQDYYASGKTKFITTGNFRNADMIEPVVNALDSLVDDLNFELHIAGPFTNEPLKQFLKRGYIIYHGDKSLQDVGNLLRQCDIFIYSHLNPPCPNSVIEAASCGLPITGFKSGAMEEILPFSTELLADVSSQTFQEYRDFKPELLAEKIKYTADNFTEMKRTAIKNSGRFSFEECGKKYLEIFERFLQQ